MPNSRKNNANAPQQQQSARAAVSSKASQASPTMPVREAAVVSISTAKIHELLQKLSDDQTKILNDQARHFADVRKDVLETRRAVEATEGRLADMLTRITSKEARTVHSGLLESRLPGGPGFGARSSVATTS